MRLLTTNLLAVALLLFGAASASAYATTATTSYTGAEGVSDTFTVTVHFDTEGASDVLLLSVGVIFDTTLVQYVGGTSQSYMLYAAGSGMNPATWIAPAATHLTVWGGSSPAPPLAKVNLDWIANTFPGAGTTQTTAGDSYTDSLGTLTFHVLGAGGAGTLSLSTSGDGNVLQLAGAGVVPNAGDGAVIITPEPSTALLIGLGLIGLGVAGRKS